MLYARAAIRNFGEVTPPHLFLFLETERTVIGRNNLQVIALQAAPEFLLMPLFTQRRSEHKFRSFEIRDIKVLNRKIQILRTGFRVHGKSTVASFPHFLERFVT